MKGTKETCKHVNNNVLKLLPRAFTCKTPATCVPCDNPNVTSTFNFDQVENLAKEKVDTGVIQVSTQNGKYEVSQIIPTETKVPFYFVAYGKAQDGKKLDIVARYETEPVYAIAGEEE